MKNILKEKTTKELAILLSSGIVGDEYKQVLKEYMSRPQSEKKHYSPSGRFKQNKYVNVDVDKIDKEYVKVLNIRELKYLIASGLNGDKHKLVIDEYANRIHRLERYTNPLGKTV